jgi:hypothetical protein
MLIGIVTGMALLIYVSSFMMVVDCSGAMVLGIVRSTTSQLSTTTFSTITNFAKVRFLQKFH